MSERINVTRSSMPDFDEYITELQDVWNSRWLSNRGEASKKFEEDLKNKLEVSNLYLFANGHLALEVTIEALGLKEGSEVITTPYTHVSTTHSITRNGLVPVFVDVNESDYTINSELIESAITERTVAIVATHVYGFICDVEKIETIAKKHNLLVVYDAAHAFGVKYKGIGVGNFGDAAMFSTHATKVFHTIEGGIVAYKDIPQFEKLRNLVNFGYVNEDEIDYIGTNARMNEFEAVMGICNLRHFDDEVAKRENAAKRYYERLDGIKGIVIPKPNSDTQWNYSYFPVLFDGYNKDRNQIKTELMRHNIYARKYFYPIVNRAKCYCDKYGEISLPVSEYASEHVLTLPMYADLTIEDVDRICDVILA